MTSASDQNISREMLEKHIDLSSIHPSLRSALNQEALSGPIVFGDTETTGFFAGKDRIIEIGAIRFDENHRFDGIFHQYYDPQISIPPDSAKVHGITDEIMRKMIQDGRARKMNGHQFSRFQDFVGDATFVAHNAKFDQSFLEAEGALFGMSFSPKHIVDTIPLGRLRFPRRKLALDMLCKLLNVSTAGRSEFHGALVDADILANMFVELIKEDPQNGLFDTPAPISNPVVRASVPVGARNIRLLGQPTPEELEAHAVFMAEKVKSKV